MSDSSYDSSQFNIERATGGLVLSLYIGAAIFLIVIVWMVLQNMETPTDASNDNSQTGDLLPLERHTALVSDVQDRSSSSTPSLYP